MTSETGVLIHFLGSMTLHMKPNATAYTRMVNFGDEVSLTDELIAANTDDFDHCVFTELLDDEQGQIARWGKVMFARGAWPSTDPLSRIERGSFRWNDARDRALAEADSLPSEEERRNARAKVREQYGLRDSAHSKTLATYGDHR